MDKAKIGKRNRINGHNFERYVKSVFIKLGFLNTATSRAVSKVADDKGIDLVNTGDIGAHDEFPLRCLRGKTHVQIPLWPAPSRR